MSNKAGSTELRLSYYPDITQYRSQEEIRSEIEVFAQALQDELCRITGLSYRIIVLPVMQVSEQLESAASEGCEIALMRPLAYIYAHRRNPLVDVGAVARRRTDGGGGDDYFAQVYVHERIGVSSLEELCNKCQNPLPERPTIGFGDSLSTSNFLVNAALLKESGIHPLTCFRRIEFFGGHDRVAQAVYDGRADVGAGHDGVIADLAKQRGFEDAQQVMHCIGRKYIHSDPVALIVRDDSVRRLIQDSLLAIEKMDGVKKALKIFWGEVCGLGPTTHEKYKSIEDSIDALGICYDELSVK
ncbi:PhnD/SsuA/transferrin family substrate-binding protein [Nocardia beijingensis]|uniref:phosphate/phosphite/phosphonate ABC transporter substrate-binding protein n=1 Tax=Nocardia beijingensis TaxID=95162 RepID=UPI001894B7BC|nr:PhnD/SsuA/transferrin family substrate-binding protein [Nocardia beijingensis]MBF6468264.1 PhnD/SsuA/transferrin family substrate-binding protein [Nocardia beijingensis]